MNVQEKSRFSSTGEGGQKESNKSVGEKSVSEKTPSNIPDGESIVGAVGIIPAAVFLILLTVGLLYGITTQWPVCDLPEDQKTDAPSNTNANNNQSATAPANDNSSSQRANTNAATNANANIPANTNANAGGQTNTNARANTPTPSPGTSPTSAKNASAGDFDADTLEPTEGTIYGKTLVTIKGKNFGSATEGMIVRFGEQKAQVYKVSDKTISVRTPRHSEGLVDVTVEKGGKTDALESAYTYVCPAPHGSGLFFMLIMAGGLGGCIHSLRSLYWYAGQGQLKWRWLLMYFTLPFIGAGMAMIFSLLIFAGFVDNTTGRSQALFIIAAAGLVGMFSQQAALKLTDVANAFFTKPGEGKDAEPQKSLSVSQRETKGFPVTATTMTPVEGVARGGVDVKIEGSGFNTSTKVNFGSTAAKIKTFDATSITVETPPGTAGTDVEVEVKSGDQSVKLPVKFKYI